MATAENKLGQDNHTASRITRFSTDHPVLSTALYLGSTVATLVVFASGMHAINEPGMKAAERAKVSAEATATVIAHDARALLEDDYIRTGGLDLAKSRDSYTFTLRDSASVAKGTDRLTDNAWMRAKDDGCEPRQMIVFPDVTGNINNPRAIQIFVNCPPRS